MLCVIWYHLYNFKNVKNTHGGGIVLACNFTKSNNPLMVMMVMTKMMKENCFGCMVDWWYTSSLISSRDQIFTIANLQHTASRVWSHAEREFKFIWMNLCSIDNHYTTVPWVFFTGVFCANGTKLLKVSDIVDVLRM